ncbi:uncharacterized protein CTHT_0044740 [Thermochaetoides thermophila DSM 1495]|uniref:Uncharacterized protein n=1 Tax=Chaetomium thermophilum (strain DSM 1495 / CBS 144.50 / IMI 039719) TaxID=759272 RepID=G0S967_CHATD|nr:hypothetical protein CTHT_0044740 [Thermochaetoides thermophila DSM 1495]EGS19978.1 hypothetical protein CTHT_0044740 [Thermochaetoides thermophila DSM 1495]
MASFIRRAISGAQSKRGHSAYLHYNVGDVIVEYITNPSDQFMDSLGDSSPSGIARLAEKAIETAVVIAEAVRYRNNKISILDRTNEKTKMSAKAALQNLLNKLKVSRTRSAQNKEPSKLRQTRNKLKRNVPKHVLIAAPVVDRAIRIGAKIAGLLVCFPLLESTSAVEPVTAEIENAPREPNSTESEPGTPTGSASADGRISTRFEPPHIVPVEFSPVSLIEVDPRFTDPRYISLPMPSHYWTGRFMALEDRVKSERLDPQNFERARMGCYDDGEIVAARVFEVLAEYCMTDEALRSLHEWQTDFARRAGNANLLPSGVDPALIFFSREQPDAGAHLRPQSEEHDDDDVSELSSEDGSYYAHETAYETYAEEEYYDNEDVSELNSEDGSYYAHAGKEYNFDGDDADDHAAGYDNYNSDDSLPDTKSGHRFCCEHDNFAYSPTVSTSHVPKPEKLRAATPEYTPGREGEDNLIPKSAEEIATRIRNAKTLMDKLKARVLERRAAREAADAARETAEQVAHEQVQTHTVTSAQDENEDPFIGTTTRNTDFMKKVTMAAAREPMVIKLEPVNATAPRKLSLNPVKAYKNRQWEVAAREIQEEIHRAEQFEREMQAKIAARKDDVAMLEQWLGSFGRREAQTPFGDQTGPHKGKGYCYCSNPAMAEAIARNPYTNMITEIVVQSSESEPGMGVVIGGVEEEHIKEKEFVYLCREQKVQQNQQRMPSHNLSAHLTVAGGSMEYKMPLETGIFLRRHRPQPQGLNTATVVAAEKQFGCLINKNTTTCTQKNTDKGKQPAAATTTSPYRPRCPLPLSSFKNSSINDIYGEGNKNNNNNNIYKASAIRITTQAQIYHAKKNSESTDNSRNTSSGTTSASVNSTGTQVHRCHNRNYSYGSMTSVNTTGTQVHRRVDDEDCDTEEEEECEMF